jgi:hypothetical protein
MAKTKYDWLVRKKKWGAKSPDDEKIVAMAAEIKSLKGQLKLNPSWLRSRTRRTRTRRVVRSETKRTLRTSESRRRMRPGRRSHLKAAIPRRRNKGILPTIGANTTWHGRSTSLLIVALARGTRRNRNRPSAPTLRPWPLPPPLLSTLTMRPCWPPLASSKMTNDGARRHGWQC